MHTTVEIANAVLTKMQALVSGEVLSYLESVLMSELRGIELEVNALSNVEDEASKYMERFLAAKTIEGCSPKTIRYYKATLTRALEAIKKPIIRISSDDLRTYLSEYPIGNNAGSITVDNVRRILSSFFSWLEDENHILKSPARRIKKIRSKRTVKSVYSDEELIALTDACSCKRDLAIINLLSSTGMRIGELVSLNREDVDLNRRECIVLGKGNKERVVYFDATTKLHLNNYLQERSDNVAALFCSLTKPSSRLQVSGVELSLRSLGTKAGVKHVHPHKFRRTLATKAIGKGMPIEQVQKLLGHQKIDTTLMYAMVDQDNVRDSHRRYIC